MPVRTFLQRIFVAPVIVAVLVVVFVGGGWAADQPASAPRPAEPPLALRRDAELVDVCFVDAQHGWAVGDRGTIWQTADAGQNWALQSSGIPQSLTAVSFSDANHGWAVGGQGIPYTPVSRGIVLRTSDGGQKWTVEDKATVPALTHVANFGRQGFAAGPAASLFPAGLFTTTDDGRTWNALPAGEFQHVAAVTFSDPETALWADHAGRLHITHRGRTSLADAPRSTHRRIRALKMASPRVGWAVGDGGLVWQTVDAGRTWRLPPSPLPPLVTQHFDFRAVTARGDDVWLVGSPGALVVRSTDAGRTWSVAPTRQTAPLRAITFIDRHRGWAVGAFGTILATRDGGESWTVQQRGGTRAGVAFFFPHARDVPWELVAQLAGNDGHFAVVQTLPTPLTEAEPFPLDHRFREAAVELGAAWDATWRFPLDEPDLRLVDPQVQFAAWSEQLGDDAARQLPLQVARWVRCWRPDVLLVPDVDPDRSSSATRLISQHLLRGVELAAADDDSPTATGPPTATTSLAATGLPPWQVKRVFAVTAENGSGTWELSTGKIAPRLGRSLGDATLRARGLIHDQFQPPPGKWVVRTLVDRTGAAGVRSELFDGLAVTPGESRRAADLASTDTLAALQTSAAARRSALALIDYARQHPRLASGWLSQVEQFTRGLDAPSAAELIFQLASNFQHHGRWDLAADAHELLVRRFPHDPLAQASAWQLARLHGSGEIARQRGAGAPFAVKSATAEVPREKSPRTSRAASRVATFAASIDNAYPALAAEPSWRLSVAAALRRDRLPRDADQLLRSTLLSRPRDAWWSCLQGELSLAAGDFKPASKPVCRVVRATSKPRLDGQLDDELWQTAEPTPLVDRQHPQAKQPTVVQFAYDDEFLYVAVRARKVRDYDYTPSTEPRPRDAALADHDRLELALDTDRDYATWYHLAIDHRGWAQESLAGHAAWNPPLYIAPAADAAAWTVEAAIPLAELATPAPRPGDIWSLGLERRIPRLGRHTWTTPLPQSGPAANLGYLRFE